MAAGLKRRIVAGLSGLSEFLHAFLTEKKILNLEFTKGSCLYPMAIIQPGRLTTKRVEYYIRDMPKDTISR